MVLGSQVSSHKGKGIRKAAHKQPAPSGIVLAATHLPHGLGFGASGASSSHSVGHSYISTNSFGHRTLRQEILHSAAIQVRQDHDQLDYQHHHDSISLDERTRLANIRADEDFTDQDDVSQVDIHNILSGDATTDVSHAGGEFAELLAIEDGLLGPASRYVCAFTTQSYTNVPSEDSMLPTTEHDEIEPNVVQLLLSFKSRHLSIHIWLGRPI
jgi:hypothetical protein